MIWHNDWIWHNLDDRLKNKNEKFKFGIKPYSFKITDFRTASEKTAISIYNKHKKIYVALSGGMDSLYVTKIFHECSIPFTPVIVHSDANKEETSYAFQYCETNELIPHVIQKTEKELVSYYIKNVYSKMFSVGVNITAAFLTQQYASENDGIMISGDYLIDIEHDTITCSDFDYFRDVLLGPSINFFSDNPTIAYAMTKEAQIPFFDTKYQLYGFTSNRMKLKYEYTSGIYNVVKEMDMKSDKTKYEYTLMSRSEFLTEMEKYGV
jgi:hypothetical protein